MVAEQLELTLNLDELRRLAEAATPGPWEAYSAMCCPDMGGVTGKTVLRVCADKVGRYGHPTTIEDASFIASANPATVLALLDRLDAAEARCAALDEAVMRINAEHLDDVQRLTRERDEAIRERDEANRSEVAAHQERLAGGERLTKERDEAEQRTADAIAAWLEDRGDSCNPVNSARLIREGKWRK